MKKYFNFVSVMNSHTLLFHKTSCKQSQRRSGKREVSIIQNSAPNLIKAFKRVHAHAEACVCTNISTKILILYYAIQITEKHSSETSVIPIKDMQGQRKLANQNLFF